MSVLIDRYELKLEQSPKVIIYDTLLELNIVSVNTLNKDYNLALASIVLDELNTGKYEDDSS